ncbi:lipocalin-like domain-containing protein [Undibacterium sp. TJN19]|uniref:lipocalin-like domain-containing protein n=1 Tax=Undibacterium sp. TJN19 TaxID=3413055 RepID=UPI003BF0E341
MRYSKASYFSIISGLLLAAYSTISLAAPPDFSTVRSGTRLQFPADFGAHPTFRNEWWYVTGLVDTPDHHTIGFQITFFRSATEYDRSNPSAFAPSQLVIAHAALSDANLGQLLHDQKSARSGFGLAYAKEGNTDVKLSDWHLLRNADGSYQAQVQARDFRLQLKLARTQPMLLQGEAGYSRKGPKQEQASYYYSEPQLQVTGKLTRLKAPAVASDSVAKSTLTDVAITGKAWLDHEWSTSVLDAQATGWDWLGVNLDNGDVLMAFQIRNQRGEAVWAHATLRDKSGQVTQFPSEQIRFQPERIWRSPRTNAAYPVATAISTGNMQWQIIPLQDDQELDSRRSTGAVYWEGAVTIQKDGKRVGQGYLEMTGYVKPMKL